VTKDFTRAAHWFSTAAEQRHALAVNFSNGVAQLHAAARAVQERISDRRHHGSLLNLAW